MTLRGSVKLRNRTVFGFMGLGAWAILLAVCGLAKLAAWLNICPQWLREFKIEKHTLY